MTLFESLWLSFIEKLQNFLNAPRTLTTRVDNAGVVYREKRCQLATLTWQCLSAPTSQNDLQEHLPHPPPPK